MLRALSRTQVWRWRRPSPLSLIPLAMALSVHVGGSMMSLANNFLRAHLPLPFTVLWTWGALSLLSYGLAWLGGWLWRHRVRGWTLRLSPGGAWLVFVALAVGFSLAAGLTRSGMALCFLPEYISPTKAQNFAITQALCCLSAYWGLEWLAHNREGHLQRLALKAKLLAHMVDEQSAWVRHDDRQRRQVAEWLHGRIQSLLWAAWAEWRLAQKASPQVAAEHLQSLKAKLSLVAQESQGPLLAPVASGALSVMPERLSQLAEAFDGVLALKTQVDPSLVAEGLDCEGEVLAAACLLVEEALLNASKHGQAHGGEIRLLPASAKAVSLVVSMDGASMAPPQEWGGQGLGLGVLVPHLESLGGSCAWSADAWGNLRMTLALPLKHQAA